jgi:thiol-disulfide isomerase/thioredoxin
MRKIILIIIIFINTQDTFSQVRESKQYKLIAFLKNAPFNSLALLDYREHHNLIIKGKSIGQFKWEFTVPDSVLQNSENMMLIVPEKDELLNAYHQINFVRNFKNKKTSFVNIGLQDERNYIEAEYQGRSLFENVNISSFINEIDTVVRGNLMANSFNLLVRNDGSDIHIRSIDPYYSWFYNDEKKMSYSDYLLSYTQLAKKYPNSRYLISSLSRNLNQYKTKQDVIKIYQNFSKDALQYKWSKNIELFLKGRIQDLSLDNIKSSNTESIILDSLKYNLLIFSASWCIPCIKEIPLLKKLHESLSQHITFTFVSMDDEKSVKTFEKILIENKVSWRTLYAYKNLNGVKDFFSIKSLPHSLLIHPNGKMEVIDVRDVKNQEKLYNLN